jgi:hypothetical protein
MSAVRRLLQLLTGKRFADKCFPAAWSFASLVPTGALGHLDCLLVQHHQRPALDECTIHWQTQVGHTTSVHALRPLTASRPTPTLLHAHQRSNTRTHSLAGRSLHACTPNNKHRSRRDVAARHSTTRTHPLRNASLFVCLHARQRTSRRRRVVTFVRSLTHRSPVKWKGSFDCPVGMVNSSNPGAVTTNDKTRMIGQLNLYRYIHPWGALRWS